MEKRPGVSSFLPFFRWELIERTLAVNLPRDFEARGYIVGERCVRVPRRREHLLQEEEVHP